MLVVVVVVVVVIICRNLKGLRVKGDNFLAECRSSALALRFFEPAFSQSPKNVAVACA